MHNSVQDLLTLKIFGAKCRFAGPLEWLRLFGILQLLVGLRFIPLLLGSMRRALEVMELFLETFKGHKHLS